jgi:hypothetical protein
LLIAALISACGAADGGGGGDSSSSGQATVTLVWDVVVGANGYRIYYRSAPGSYVQNMGEGIDAGHSTTYSVTGLVGGITYCFAATAYGSNGESDFSNEACHTTVDS